jgi:NADH-quinone oxidoreductase subunit K
MNVEWYVVLSALLFAVGAGGVLIRRSPVVILLCLELMLNAGNLALVAFSRMLGDQDGQVFALIVMVIGMCRGCASDQARTSARQARNVTQLDRTSTSAMWKVLKPGPAIVARQASPMSALARRMTIGVR